MLLLIVALISIALFGWVGDTFALQEQRALVLVSLARLERTQAAQVIQGN